MGKLKINYFSLVVIHLFLGLVIFAFESLSTIYFLLVIIGFFFGITQAKIKDKPSLVLIACSFIIGSEVFLRMTGGNLLYEISKYSVIAFLIVGIFYSSISKKSYIYVIYILMLVPGIIIASSTLNYDTIFRKAVAFNLSGPVCLGLAALFCYQRKISMDVLDKITMVIILPIVSNTVYLYLYNPNIKDVLSGTQSNFEASGGFGPNQVATILGLGMFVLIARYVLFSKNLFQKILNITLLVLVSYRAIITFSRGGVLTAIIITVIFLFIYLLFVKGRKKQELIRSIVIVTSISVAVWIFTSIQTYGFIDKRYANQDAAGRVKDDITTGRVNLLSSEFQEFFNNPFLGVGVGKIKEIRFEKSGARAASHNEMSRLLSEHGSFGVVALFILLIAPLTIRSRNKSNFLFFSFYFFWFLTINHSSMRIAAPAFIYGLCLLTFTDEKNSIHRQQVIQKG